MIPLGEVRRKDVTVQPLGLVMKFMWTVAEDSCPRRRVCSKARFASRFQMTRASPRSRGYQEEGDHGNKTFR